MHEVVVRNRLEQLRKRQRDEAVLAQEELLAGVAKNISKGWGGDLRAEAVMETPETANAEVEEVTEPYERSMSPALLDIRKLPYDDRQIRVVSEKEDLQALVIRLPFLFHEFNDFLTLFSARATA